MSEMESGGGEKKEVLRKRSWRVRDFPASSCRNVRARSRRVHPIHFHSTACHACFWAPFNRPLTRALLEQPGIHLTRDQYGCGDTIRYRHGLVVHVSYLHTLRATGPSLLKSSTTSTRLALKHFTLLSSSLKIVCPASRIE